MKRMTLLAKKDGLSTSDFRTYWAGPHAQLALGMQGIRAYRHNRVDKLLWTRGGDKPTFAVDGIVELVFADADAMRLAQSSTIGQTFIPADEPNFLKGWTLCVVNSLGEEPAEQWVKVLIPFHIQDKHRAALWELLQPWAVSGASHVGLDWTVSNASRERLWSEPSPPSGFISCWFRSVAEAHEAFEPDAELRCILERHTLAGDAYLIDQLRLK